MVLSNAFWGFFFAILGLVIVVAIFGVINEHFSKRNAKYVRTYSVAFKTLMELNERYKFHKLKNTGFTHDYDNEQFYKHISCKDYLIYQIAKNPNDYLKDVSYADINSVNYVKYKEAIKNKCELGHFTDSGKKPIFFGHILKKEKRLLEEYVTRPVIDYSITIKLRLTQINGHYLASKSSTFNKEDVLSLVNKVQNKNGSYYRDEYIWNSICRVERGKVSNKLRFAIYRRDGNRCVKCGSRRHLEIDHIYPISKGGKSEYSNLQTLCNKCNRKKGDKIE